MAIVVEEEQGKSGGGLFAIITWVVILGVLGAAAYYIFFKNPELVQIATPTDLQNTEALSKLSLNALEDTVNNAKFQALKRYITPAPAQATPKTNPFLGF